MTSYISVLISSLLYFACVELKRSLCLNSHRTSSFLFFFFFKEKRQTSQLKEIILFSFIGITCYRHYVIICYRHYVVTCYCHYVITCYRHYHTLTSLASCLSEAEGCPWGVLLMSPHCRGCCVVLVVYLSSCWVVFVVYLSSC